MQPALSEWNRSRATRGVYRTGPTDLRATRSVWLAVDVAGTTQPAHDGKNLRRIASAVVLTVGSVWLPTRFASCRRRQRFASRLLRRGVEPERALRPRSAPGPKEELLREFKAAEVLLIRAREDLKKAGLNPRREEAKETLANAEETYADLEAQVRVAKADLQKYPVPDFLPVQGDVNIAVTGSSGVGKSSFINAVRMNLQKGQDAWAETGIFQTTKEVEQFKFPKAYMKGEQVTMQGEYEGQLAKVLRVYDDGRVEVALRDNSTTMVDPKVLRKWTCWLWDLPGVGTKDFPQATYIKDMGIRHFDLVVLMTSTRFTEPEALLLDELLLWGVPYFIVRNKIDVDIRNEAEIQGIDFEDIDDERCSGARDGTLTTIKDFLVTQLYDQLKALPKKSPHISLVPSPLEIQAAEPSKRELASAVYCVSSRSKYKDDFDMDLLRSDMWTAIDYQRDLREDVLERLRKGDYRFRTLIMGGLAKFVRGAARSFFRDLD